MREVELDKIAAWAHHNNLKLNRSKMKEIVFTALQQGSQRGPLMKIPDPPPGVVRVTSMIMLGVTMQSNLRVTEHIGTKITNCLNSLYALKTLKTHGMRRAQLTETFRATTLASLLYAAPAWWGFATSDDRQRLDAFLKRSIKTEYYPQNGPTITELVMTAEQTLFKSVRDQDQHVLRPIFPPPTEHTYNLRTTFPPIQTVSETVFYS